MNKEEILKLIQEEIKKSQGPQGFRDWDRKDAPTDAYSVVNRNYSNLNGTVATRPIGSVATVGQKYFATDTKIPMVFDGTQWRNGSGSVVAIN